MSDNFETDVYDPTTTLSALLALFNSYGFDMGLDVHIFQKFSKKTKCHIDESILDASNPEQSIRQMAEEIFNFSQLSLSCDTDTNKQGRAQLQAFRKLDMPQKLRLTENTTLSDLVQDYIQDQKAR